jgi:PAS domain S-box-containing protein
MKKKTDPHTNAKGLSVMSNMPELKLGEKPLDTSDEKYRILFESMQQGAFFQDANGRLIDINPKALHMVGLTRQEFLNKTLYAPFWKLIREDGSLLPAKEYPSVVALTTGKPVTDMTVGIFNPKTKSYVWIVANAIPLFRAGERSPCQVCVTLHDIPERKRAKAELRESEQHIRTICNNITNGMIYQAIRINNHDRKITYLSDTVREFYGITPQEGIANANLIYDRFHEEDRERIHKEEELAYKTMSTFKTEGRVINHKGEMRWSLFVSSPTKLPDGTTCWDGIEFDISDRKLAEDALRQSQERYRMLTETATDAIITANGQGLIVSWNSGAEKIYGYKPEEIIGQEFVQLIPENNRERHKEFFNLLIKKEKLLSQGKPIEGVGRRKDGSEFAVEPSFTLYWVNKEPFFTIIARDITERKQLGKKLHESEELFRLNFENAPIGICIFDKKGALLQANLFCETCFGHSREDLVRQGFPCFLHPGDKKKTTETFLTIINNHEMLGQSTVLENRFFGRDGRTIYTKQHIQGVFNTDGTLEFITVLTEDITTTKQLTLMNEAIVNKLKDVHLQLKEFSSLLADDKNFMPTKSLSDYGLSPMETRIASMIFYGHSNKKMAHKLCISENTIKHHITSIYSKLKVKNRINFINTIRVNHIIL